MKISIKRDSFNLFKKAKIEIVEVKELSFLQVAVKNYIDYMEKNNFHKSEDEDIRELHEFAIKISSELDKWK